LPGALTAEIKYLSTMRAILGLANCLEDTQAERTIAKVLRAAAT
jgi:hypothetical protein